MVKPAIEKLDEQVKNTKKSQVLLNNHIDQLTTSEKQGIKSIFHIFYTALITTGLKLLMDHESMPYDLGGYVQKLDESRRRTTSVVSRLHQLHDRIAVLQKSVLKESKPKADSPTFIG